MTTLRSGSELPVSHSSPADRDLLARVATGDQRAMASLYDRHSPLVYSIAFRVCHDPIAAEQILQNIFMQIWLAPQQFSTESQTLETTLGLLSRNLAVGLLHERSSSGPGATPSLGRPLDPVSHTEVAHLMRKPHSLVLLLPDADRQVFDMAFFDGKSPAEISEETGLPEDSIATRLSSALSSLHKDSTPCSNDSEDTGLEVLDLDTTPEFTSRNLRSFDLDKQIEGLRRLTHSFVHSPDTILQELVTAAVDLCGADSAGISLEMEERTDDRYFHWVATAGQYNGFMNAVLPRYPSACSICLERGKPQLFKVRQRFFDIMGINAPLVTDGILLPWQVEETRGTIFIMAHGRTQAFDRHDGQMMRVLADFAAMAVRHQRQQRALIEQAKAAAVAAAADKLAHQINNPLQRLMNVAYLAAEGQSSEDTKSLGQEFSTGLRKLSAAVTDSLKPSPDNSR